MTKAESQKQDRDRARKARAELDEMCSKPRNPERRRMSLRAVNYMTMRMGFKTVVSEQEPCPTPKKFTKRYT